MGNLKAHLKVHITDGPLKCKECGKQFTTSGKKMLCFMYVCMCVCLMHVFTSELKNRSCPPCCCQLKVQFVRYGHKFGLMFKTYRNIMNKQYMSNYEVQLLTKVKIVISLL